MSNHYLYRLYGQLGQLLYIGITDSLSTRLTDHRLHKDWWAEVASISVEVLPDREAVLAAEREAIQLEQPKHNRIHAQPLDLRYTPRWQKRFRLEDLPADDNITENDWLKIVVANTILDWSNGYDGRTGCLQIHPEMFSTLVRQIAEGVQAQLSSHAST